MSSWDEQDFQPRRSRLKLVKQTAKNRAEDTVGKDEAVDSSDDEGSDVPSLRLVKRSKTSQSSEVLNKKAQSESTQNVPLTEGEVIHLDSDSEDDVNEKQVVRQQKTTALESQESEGGEEEASEDSGEEASHSSDVHSEEEEEEESEEESKEEEHEEEEMESEEEEHEEEVIKSAEQSQTQRAANVAAVVGNLPMKVQRRPLMPSILTVKGAEAVLRRPFNGGPTVELKRRLFMRKRFVPWATRGFTLPKPSQSSGDLSDEEENVNPLVLWQSDIGEGDGDLEIVEVDKMLTKFLRPHQREGVQFMFECVTGIKGFDGQGCILADDMGLGKTLQGITLLWTLLRQGSETLGGKPIVKRAVIVCPTSLVGNWDNECDKWLKGRINTLALAESSRDDVIMGISQFLSPRKPYDVLIVSYETFRIHTDKFKKEGSCDLLICDEAHRLKNDATLTNQALNMLPCKRRVLLSGTPMQNHLDEFYAMVNFCNPGILGTPGHFRKHFEIPVLAGREPDATEKEEERSNERSLELSKIVNDFILRRTNSLLSDHLPPKTIEIVCCKMTQQQMSLYKHFLQSKSAKQMLNGGKQSKVLSAITALKKLCNHPKLIYDVLHSTNPDHAPDGFQDCHDFFPPGIYDNGRKGRGGMAGGWEFFSGKMAVLSRLLAILRKTGDRIVLVSNYTQTLDLFAVMCREKNYPFLRLDGTITVKKRMKLVKQFNDPAQDQFAFLLSSKAGGCGLNLIGANRLVLFDPDWNPANDKQAAARVWRDGQKKNVFVYRFLATGTIEEKVFQRQLSKEGLQGLVSADGKAKSNMTSSDVLRDLFSIREDTVSDTYDNCCHEKRGTDAAHPNTTWKQVGAPPEEDLKNWAHHFNLDHLCDDAMKEAGKHDVSFIFSCDIAGLSLDKTKEEEKPTRKPLQSLDSNKIAGMKIREKKVQKEYSDEEWDEEESESD